MFKFAKFFFALVLLVVSPALAGTNDDKNSCPTGEHWVRAHSQSPYMRGDGTLVSGSFHKAHCQKNPPAYAIWNDRLKNTFPPRWEFKNEKIKTWTDSERERVLEALSILPDSLLTKTVEGIYRMKTYLEHPPNPAANRENQIALYDEAFNPKQNLARVIAHEFAHNLYRQLYGEDQGQGYAQASDWLSLPIPGRNERILIPNRDGFVEEDGKEGPSEDFSNNIEYFLFNPNELKRKAPKVYAWISKKYGDKFKLSKGQ